MSRAARSCTCAICGGAFSVKRPSAVKKTCSPGCLREQNRINGLGRKLSDETRAKMSAAQLRKLQEPGFLEKRSEAAKRAIQEWHADPENAAAFSKRMSERMARRHTDPEFQKARNERSSRTMKRMWEMHRDEFRRMAAERYARGEACNSEEGRRNKATASQWILKKAQEALHSETDYDAVFSDVCNRMRLEMPYDGPAGDADYYDYCKKLGLAVVNAPELRAIADSFMKEAIPRFAAEWQASKK